MEFSWPFTHERELELLHKLSAPGQQHKTGLVGQIFRCSSTKLMNWCFLQVQDYNETEEVVPEILPVPYYRAYLFHSCVCRAEI